MRTRNALDADAHQDIAGLSSLQEIGSKPYGRFGADSPKDFELVSKDSDIERLIAELRLAIVVENSVIVELKRVERTDPLFEAQILTHLRPGSIKTGLLINFNSRQLHQGIKSS